MTKEEAREKLLFHSFSSQEVSFEEMGKGFLGMLRPFRGALFEANYHEVIQAIKVLADDWRNSESIDKDVISALWSICHYTRIWAIDPEGMLRRNHLISPEQVRTLEQWIDAISWATTMILDGTEDEVAFEDDNNLSL